MKYFIVTLGDGEKHWVQADWFEISNGTLMFMLGSFGNNEKSETTVAFNVSWVKYFERSLNAPG